MSSWPSTSTRERFRQASAEAVAREQRVAEDVRRRVLLRNLKEHAGEAHPGYWQGYWLGPFSGEWYPDDV